METEKKVFYGEYEETLDKDLKIKMPILYKGRFMSGGYMAKGLDGCITLYTKEAWDTLLTKLTFMPFTDKKVRIFRRTLLSTAKEFNIGSEDKIMISDILAEYADLKDECVIVGAGNEVEIWNKDRWDVFNNTNKDIEEIADKIAEYI